MAQYATDIDGEIDAWDAHPGGCYRCLECGAPVKVRRSRKRFPHFYHLAASPSCRLYSKSEDHLLIQLHLQKRLPHGEAEIERPFLEINRVADLLWEREKLVFEIQCSMLFDPEAESRIREYKKAGYDVVWILDDRRFNKRQLKPAEKFLRSQMCFFVSLNREAQPQFYDQFEIFIEKKRLKKGKKILVDLTRVHCIPAKPPPEDLPECIEKRIPGCGRYFEKDLVDRAYLSLSTPRLVPSLIYWRALEIQLQKLHRRPNFAIRFYRRYIRRPYAAFILMLLERMD